MREKFWGENFKRSPARKYDEFVAENIQAIKRLYKRNAPKPTNEESDTNNFRIWLDKNRKLRVDVMTSFYHHYIGWKKFEL